LRIPLSRHGLGVIALGGIVLAAVAGLCLWAWPPAALVPALGWAGLLAFFRDPERRPDCGPDDLVSPADGVVRDVGVVDAPAFLEGPATRVGIFMSVLDVHVNRSPADGVVRWVSHQPGGHADARRPEAALGNEHALLGIELADGGRILVRQVAGLVARRVVCEPAVGDRLLKGQRFGMIKFGSRVELLLPERGRYTVRVQPGERVKAGHSVLATRSRPGNPARGPTE
jgi:phosphatidylserine decarboxylase